MNDLLRLPLGAMHNDFSKHKWSLACLWFDAWEEIGRGHEHDQRELRQLFSISSLNERQDTNVLSTLPFLYHRWLNVMRGKAYCLESWIGYR